MNWKSRCAVIFILLTCVASLSFASAYNAKPKLVVVIVVDQLRGDILERYHDELAPDGFRLLLDHGAWFKNCYYQYANTETGPGHATIGTGTYSLGHGIMANEWFDRRRGRVVTSVEDENVTVLGTDAGGASASPRNLLTDTLADELKLATGGKAKVYSIALKDRAAILPVGFSADAAFWIDQKSGAWITSTYYMKTPPAFLSVFNSRGENKKYFNREWKDVNGKLLWTTAANDTDQRRVPSFYDRVGPTPFANDYTLDFARSLIESTNLGNNAVTDMLSISFSSHDILGHKFGPDSVQEREMIGALDRQIAAFFRYLNTRFGPENLVVALVADHGVGPTPQYASTLRIPAANLNNTELAAKLNGMLSETFGKTAKYVLTFEYPKAFLNDAAFASVSMPQADAERLVGEMMVKLGLRGYVTKSDLADGRMPATNFAQQLRNSYSPLPNSYVIGFPAPFVIGYASGASHGQPFSYDAHVPLVLYGKSFKPGTYYQATEPIDLVVTLSSILGVNKPASATGRVLAEGIVQ